MSTEVIMPQMGESIAEGTIVRWIKKVGDQVDRDEPLFEISTDKVDAEIPSPAAGVVSEIRVKEGETVPVNSVVAVIGGAAQATGAGSPGTPPPAAPETPRPSQQADGAPATTAAERTQPVAPPRSVEPPPGPRPPTPSPAARESLETKPTTSTTPTESTESAIRQRSSPLVRRIAQEHNVDISQLHGTGIAGRVTKNDILSYLQGQERPEGRERPAGPERREEGQVGQLQPIVGGTVEKMSPMRKRIAEHMVLSRRTSAHVHSVFEVNFTRVAQARAARKAEFERAGTKLTYLSFIAKAVIDALHAVPLVNASIDGDNIVYHREINIGIAVALDWGLIVPVIKHADEKNLLGLSRSIADLANRARTKQLKPDDVQGGTFTITNPGVFGALFGMPIINQPQVAILGVGNVEKRPVVIDDAIAIRQMAYLTLGYDHRIVDGAVADQFMSLVKRTLENWDSNAI
jgi:pyruvate dehydrogenase E2 component (dihydrolipoyllysine-residue acetyltransferase)